MRKLKVRATVGRAYAVVSDPHAVIGCAGAWPIFLLVALVIRWWAGPNEPEWLGAIIEPILSAGIFVNVYRFVLLGESPRMLRFGRSELRYVWRMTLLSLQAALLFAALVLFYFLAPLALALDHTGRILVGVLLACIAIYAFFEFLGSVLVLPAAALNRPDFGLRRAWDVTEGNKVGIFVVFLACSVPLALLSYGTMLVVGLAGSLAADLVRIIFDVLGFVIFAAWTAAVFDGLVDGNPEFTTGPPPDASASA